MLYYWGEQHFVSGQFVILVFTLGILQLEVKDASRSELMAAAVFWQSSTSCFLLVFRWAGWWVVFLVWLNSLEAGSCYFPWIPLFSFCNPHIRPPTRHSSMCWLFLAIGAMDYWSLFFFKELLFHANGWTVLRILVPCLKTEFSEHY